MPVKLYSATESKRIGLREVHLADGARIQHRRICLVENQEVPYGEVIKGYEVDEDEYVVLEPEEVKAAAGDRGKRIEIEEFVDADEIDPVFYEKTYYLGSRDDDEAYTVLHEALRRTGRAGIGHFTFHGREYLVSVRSRGTVLVLHTLHFQEELVEPGKVRIASPKRQPSKRELDLARRLIESLRIEFEPERYEDTYRQAVLDLIERKVRGERIEPGELMRPEATPDLAAALEASLA